MKKQVTINVQQASILLIIFLIGVVAGVFQPFWNNNTSSHRTVDVSGSSTVKSEPDEFVFYPSYEVSGKSREDTLAKVTAIGEKAIGELKKLGVEDKQITNTVNSYDDYKSCIDNCESPTGVIASYGLTITITNKDLSDKVYSYLLDSNAEGAITPSANFSESKLKELKSSARAAAVEEAKQQAQQIADELNLKIGSVISIEEVDGFEGVMPMSARDIAVSSETNNDKMNIGILTGEQELAFTVKATFELK